MARQGATLISGQWLKRLTMVETEMTGSKDTAGCWNSYTMNLKLRTTFCYGNSYTLSIKSRPTYAKPQMFASITPMITVVILEAIREVYRSARYTAGTPPLPIAPEFPSFPQSRPRVDYTWSDDEDTRCSAILWYMIVFSRAVRTTLTLRPYFRYIWWDYFITGKPFPTSPRPIQNCYHLPNKISVWFVYIRPLRAEDFCIFSSMPRLLRF